MAITSVEVARVDTRENLNFKISSSRDLTINVNESSIKLDLEERDVLFSFFWSLLATDIERMHNAKV